MRLAMISYFILATVFTLKNTFSAELSTGSIHGRVTIGVNETPITAGMFSGVEVYVMSLDSMQEYDERLVGWEEVIDSLGYYEIDSIPIGSVAVIVSSDLPSPHPKAAMILAGSQVELNFVIAPRINGAEHEFGLDYGVREAQQMWNMGLGGGKERNLSWNPPYCMIDSLTGLTKSTLHDQNRLFSIGFVEGYNDKTLQLIEQFGLPSNARKPWVNILLNLKTYFESQVNAGLVDTVWHDGPPLFSPDSSYYLLGGNGYRPHRVETYRNELIEMDYFKKEFSEIVWVPNGADFFISKYFDLAYGDSDKVLYGAQGRDHWRPLAVETYDVDSHPQRDIGVDTAQELGSLEGIVTFGIIHEPVFEAIVILSDNPSEYYLSGKVVWNLGESTDSSGYYRIDSIPVGEATLSCRTDILSNQQRRIVVLPDTVVRQDFVVAPEFPSGPFEYGLVHGRILGKRDWMLKQALLLYNRNWNGFTFVDSATGLPIQLLGRENESYELGLTTGYNTAIDSLIKSEGLPSYSKKPWLNIIGDIETYFRGQEKIGRIDTLWQFGKPIVSPDSAIYLRYGIDHEIHCYERDNVCLDIEAPYSSVDEYRVVAWGPEKSKFYIIEQVMWKYSIYGEANYVAYDFDGYTVLNKEYHIFK